MRSHNLTHGVCRFYVDTGAEISTIKLGSVNINTPIDTNHVISISGVTSGESFTLGKVHMILSELPCELHVVPDSFPIETDGLLGWDVFEAYGGQVNAARRCLEFCSIMIPFVPENELAIPPHTRKIIYARVTNPDVEVGFVPLQDIGPGLLFGNFVTVK